MQTWVSAAGWGVGYALRGQPWPESEGGRGYQRKGVVSQGCSSVEQGTLHTPVDASESS